MMPDLDRWIAECRAELEALQAANKMMLLPKEALIASIKDLAAKGGPMLDVIEAFVDAAAIEAIETRHDEFHTGDTCTCEVDAARLRLFLAALTALTETKP